MLMSVILSVLGMSENIQQLESAHSKALKVAKRMLRLLVWEIGMFTIAEMFLIERTRQWS